MSRWDDEPRPEREWVILDRVPVNQVGLFSGEGGAGKSIIEMTKDVAHVAGKDWLGSLPALGPAFYIGAEDEEREIHIRFYDIANYYGVTFTELIAGGLHVLCKLGQDATLCALTRSGRVETTAFYRQLYEAAGDIKPKNISIDTLSRAFAGNEMANCFAASFAVLPFEPHTTMPPSTAAIAAAMAPGSNRIAPRSIAASTMPPAPVAIREARINLRQLSILAASSSMCSSSRTISSCRSPSLLLTCKVQHPHNAAGARGDLRGQDKLAAALDLGSKLFDVLLQPHNLVVQVAVAFVDMQKFNTPDGSPIGVP